MGTATKLSLVGGTGLAAIAGAIGAYRYFTDSDLGAKRRKAAVEMAEEFLESLGLDDMAQAQMEKLMESLARSDEQ